jgi:uncharacterized membrane protein YccC
LASTVKDRASEVKEELVDQSQTLLRDAREQVETQAEQQARRLGESLVSLGNEAEALAAGRPQDAPHLRRTVESCGERLTGYGDRLYNLADDLEQRGISGVAQDVADFARRRPGAFLLGAAIAGFAAARVVRTSASSDDTDGDVRAGNGSQPSSSGRRTSAQGRGR